MSCVDLRLAFLKKWIRRANERAIGGNGAAEIGMDRRRVRDVKNAIDTAVEGGMAVSQTTRVLFIFLGPQLVI